MILLDTHAALWLATAPAKLSGAATRAIRKAASSDGMALCSISLWELAMLLARGRVKLRTGSPDEFLEALVRTPGLRLVEVTPAIAVQAAAFPKSYSADPADRIIGATARTLGLAVVTKDSAMHDSPLIRTIW